jgi:DNA invertase Pin-like site-specific DNA recombinase
MPAIIYCRKSTDDNDHQVLSIDAQIESLTALGEKTGAAVSEVLTESRTAKRPGRPVFGAMMRRIERVNHSVLLCWSIDRLARNPVDAGRIMWALKEHGLEIVTPTRTFKPGDEATLVLYLEFAMAQKFSEDLGRNVERGLERKAKMGWCPTQARLGYRNNTGKRQGERDISADPERFDIVRRMFDLMLTGQHTPPQLLRIATNRWGLRMSSGKPFSLSGIYRLLTDPFYYGQFEYPKGSGAWYRGKHPPMITVAEYDRIQVLLGREGRPRAIKRSLPYRGLILCGACGAGVTAEEKHQLICPKCRLKFAYRNRDRCRRCGSAVSTMRLPVILKYTYYHCTRRKDPTCREPVVRLENLEAQIDAALSRFSMSDRAFRWGMKFIAEHRTKRRTELATVRAAHDKAYADCSKRLNNLVALKTSPANVNGSLLSDDEYARERTSLLKEKAKLEAAADLATDPLTRATVQVTDTLQFVSRLRERLAHGSPALKGALMSQIGSNLTLTEKTLHLEPRIPFRIIEEEFGARGADPSPFEPQPDRTHSGDPAPPTNPLPIQCTPRDDVRTYQRRVHRAVKRLLAFFLDHPDYAAPTSPTENLDPDAHRDAA